MQLICICQNKKKQKQKKVLTQLYPKGLVNSVVITDFYNQLYNLDQPLIHIRYEILIHVCATCTLYSKRIQRI